MPLLVPADQDAKADAGFAVALLAEPVEADHLGLDRASCARAGEGQQLLVDEFAHRSFHGQVKQKAGRQPLSALKLLKSDPAAVLAEGEDIKARYAKLFRV